MPAHDAVCDRCNQTLRWDPSRRQWVTNGAGDPACRNGHDHAPVTEDSWKRRHR